MNTTPSVESVNLLRRDIAALRQRIDRTYDLLSGATEGGGGESHYPVTLGDGNDSALSLNGQELTLADVLTPSEGDARYARSIGEGPGIDVTGESPTQTVGLGGDTILLYGGGDPVAEFAATDAGLEAASAAAAAGDVVWLPAVTISGDHTLTAGVHYIGVSRYASILTGQITASSGSTLECVTIVRTANDTDPLKGILGPATGTAKVRDCDVTCVQAGSGPAYGASLESAGDLEVWLCYLYGASTGGIGYGVSRTGGGNLYVYSGRCVGSSYPASE